MPVVPSNESSRLADSGGDSATRAKRKPCSSVGGVPWHGKPAMVADGRWLHAAKDRLEAAQALRRPELAAAVVDVEGRCSLREGHPPDLRACVDVHVGRDADRIVKRSAPYEAHFRTPVLAEDRHLTFRAPKDPLRAAVVAGRVHRLRRSREHLYAVSLDQQVDDESAAGLTLTVQAVAAMNEHRLRPEPVPDRAARASTVKLNAHAGHPTSPQTDCSPAAASPTVRRRDRVQLGPLSPLAHSDSRTRPLAKCSFHGVPTLWWQWRAGFGRRPM